MHKGSRVLFTALDTLQPLRTGDLATAAGCGKLTRQGFPAFPCRNGMEMPRPQHSATSSLQVCPVAAAKH